MHFNVFKEVTSAAKKKQHYSLEFSDMVVSQNGITKILKNKLDEIQVMNPAFSLRSFSEMLEINSGNLSRIISGKRTVSHKFAKKMADKLKLTNAEREVFFKSFLVKEKLNHEVKSKIISEDFLSRLPELPIMTVATMANLDDFKVTSGNVAKKLKISIDEAETIIKFLFEQKVFSYDDNGDIVRIKESLSTFDNVPNDYLKRCQIHNLKKGIDSILEDDITRRDFTAMTMAIDTENIPMAKELIRKFHQDMSALLSCGNKQEVYKLTVGLYPLTKQV